MKKEKVSTAPERRQVVTPMTYQPNPEYDRVCETASRTVPDKTMSIKEILARHKAGTLDGMSVYSQPGQPIYDEDNPFPGVNFQTLDLAEIQQMKEEAQAKVADMKSKMSDYQRKQVEQQQAYVKELEEQIKKLTSKPEEENKN